MTTAADRRSRTLDATYRVHGEPADWTPVGGGPTKRVTIKRADADAVVDFGESKAVLASLKLKVRRKEINLPSKNDQVVLDPDGAAERMQIIGQPVRGRYGDEWLCDAKRV